MRALPLPECPLGYPSAQVEEIVGEDKDRFWRWFRGQTGAICEGRRYDYEQKCYVPDECAEHPHGPVVYAHDLIEFIRYDGRVTTDW